MTITQLRLRRFKRFGEWSATLGPGLTVVRGPNEAGKSTLMDAVFEGLFREPPRGEGATRLRSWGEQRLGEITIAVELKDRRYLLRKDLEAGTTLLMDEDGRERLESVRDVQRRLLEWMGLASEAAYRSTAFVAQSDLERVTEDRRLLSTHLSRVLSGSGVETVQEALQWLSYQRSRLTAPAASGRSLQDHIADLQAQQRAQQQERERAQRHRAELREVLQRLETAEREAASISERHRLAQSAVELKTREAALDNEEAGLREEASRAEALSARLAALDDGLADFSAQQEALIADLFHARRQYLQFESGLTQASEQARREERVLEQLATSHQQAARRGGMGWTLAGSGIIGVVGGVLIATLLAHGIGWVLALLGAATIAVAMRYRGRSVEAGTDYRSQEQKVLDLRRRTEVLRMQIAEAQELVAVKLRALGGASLEDVERRFSGYMELLREREEIRASLRLMRGGDPKAAWEPRLREIAEERDRIRAQLRELAAEIHEDAGSLDVLQQQAKTLTGEVHDLREKRARLEGILDELRERGDGAVQIDEEIADLKDRAERDRQSIEILDLTSKWLEEARSLSVYPARELMERRAGEYLSVATNGAYSRVAMDERALRPQVWVPAAGTWKEADDLSQGTADQLYFCLRLALLDVITGDRRPPLLLDEPFAHLDEGRRRAMLGLLHAAARERQVILFTCWPHFDEIADRVVTLDRAA